MPVLESSSDTKYQLQLPTVSFRVIDDKSLEQPAGVSSGEIRSYGYNDFSDFVRKEHYIRYIEPIESELRAQVEYDMDEQDQAWLDAINLERQKEQSGPISYEVFEILIDKLEKEWFELSKRIPQPASHLPVEDSKCAVCDDGEGENSNAIVFCDGCNLAVHQDCYGVPYIPEGQWLCRKCTVSPENPVSCLFCPNEGGAFKQTTTGHWSHLLCAIWIPDLGVGNAIYMEPVEGVESIPKNRWKLLCSLCREKAGACIQCDNRSCFAAFHVTCARQRGLLQSMKAMGSDTQLRAFCRKHLPADARDSGDLDDDADSNFSGTPIAPRIKLSARGAVTTKSARAHAKSYRPGPPIVPNIIVKSLLDYVAKISIRKRQPFIERLCRYWSLKREARRGAPLLKRLHLEPWTATKTDNQQTDAEKALKLKFMITLRNDLEKVRLLVDSVKKREREKLRQMQVIKDTIDMFMFPQYPRLRLILEKVSAMDRSQIFLHPVSRVEVPDYYDVIKQPMCWSIIDDKLERHAYTKLADFTGDIQLVWENAILYNAADTPFHKTAQRIKVNAQPLLDSLVSITAPNKLSLNDASELPYQTNVGDLEPSLLTLQVLTSLERPEADRDNLASLFAYELEKPKEPTPPPPTPPPAPVRKTQTAEERRKKREERDAKVKERASLSGRNTRGAKALEKAFAEEAGVNISSSDADLTAGRRTRGRPSGLTFDTPIKRNQGAKKKSTGGRAKNAKGDIADEAKGEGAVKRQDIPTNEDLTGVVATESGVEMQDEADDVAHTTKEASVDTTATRRSRTQPGVAALEIYSHITDKERRERERALDIVTEEVGNMDQFKRFNVGWVLPEGTKRRRVEKAPEPPKTHARKRKSTSNFSAGPTTTQLESPEIPSTPRLDSSPAPPSGSSLTPVSSIDRTPRKSPDPDHIEVAPMKKQNDRPSLGNASNRPRINDKFASGASESRSKKRKRQPSVDSAATNETETIIHAANAGTEEMTPAPQTSAASHQPAELGEEGFDDNDDGNEMEKSHAESIGVPKGRRSPRGSTSVGSLKPNRRKSAPKPENMFRRREPMRTPRQSTTTPHGGDRSPSKPAVQKKRAGPDSSPLADLENMERAKKKHNKLDLGDEEGADAEHDTTKQGQQKNDDEDDENEEEEKKGEEEDLYPPQTLVWARALGYPYFPAEVMDPELVDLDDPIPPKVLQQREKHERKARGRVWLVRFFDKTATYAWIPADRLDPLGVDDQDEYYLAGRDGRSSGFKSARIREQCHAGYREAQQYLADAALADEGEENREKEEDEEVESV